LKLGAGWAITRFPRLERGRSSGVEHNLAKVRVGRSNRLARSNFNSSIRQLKVEHYQLQGAFFRVNTGKRRRNLRSHKRASTVKRRGYRTPVSFFASRVSQYDFGPIAR
jgi:hypothetical protein